MEDRIGSLVARKRNLVGSRVQVTKIKSIHAEKVHLQHHVGGLKKNGPQREVALTGGVVLLQ